MKYRHPLLPFLGYSLLVHLALGMIAMLWQPSKDLSRFVVLGAHSSKEQQVYFKALRQANKKTAEGQQKSSGQKTKHGLSPAKKTAAPALPQSKAAPTPSKKTKQKKQSKQSKFLKKAPAKKLPKQQAKPEKKQKQKPLPPPAPAVEPEVIKKVAPEPEPSTPPQAIEELSAIPLEDSAIVSATPSLMATQEGTLGDEQETLIQQEISRLWRPPLGVPKGTTCRARFSINKQGEVHLFEFLTRSGVLIYDLSITRVAKQFRFPRQLWDKTFEVDFKQ